jgi:hypothetical protein
MKHGLFNKFPWESWAGAVSVGAILFLTSYLLDALLVWLGISSAKTILDNVTIAFIGSGAAYLWIRWEAEKRARIRERLILIAELNHHIRNALLLVGQSAVSRDQEQKLRLIDEVFARIDRVLTELVPTASTVTKPRLFLEEEEGSLAQAPGLVKPWPQGASK